MAPSGSGEKLFNPLKRRVIRSRIPRSEAVFGAVFLLFVAAAVVWVLAQRDRYDPAERDISFEVLQKDSVEDTLYRPPLKRWVEPGTPTAGGAPAVDLGVFPASLLDDGWELDGRVETYDPDTLFEKIDGAAEQYLAYGFRQLHYATLARDDRFLNVELYDQASFRNALGLFASQRDPSREVRSEGDVYYYPTSAGAVGGYDRYYFKIAGDRDDETLRAKALEIVAALGSLPSSGEPPPRGYVVLTRGLGVPLEGVAYQRSDAFQYDFVSDVWFGAVGDGSEARYFVHQAADEGEARELWERLVEEQSFDYEVLEEGEDLAVLRHRYLGTVFAMALRGRVVAGVEGAANEGAARAGLRRLDDALRAMAG